VKLKSKTKTILAAVLLASAMGQGPVAQAGPTLTMSFSSDHGELFPSGGDVMGIDFNNGSKSVSTNVKAGMFSANVDDSDDFDVSRLYLDKSNVLVYCVDILQELRKTSTAYDVNEITQGQEVVNHGVRRDFGRTLTFLGAVNHVLSENYGLGFGDKNWLNPNAGWMSGAVQLGIWESLYEEKDTILSIANDVTDAGTWFSATGVDTKGSALLSAAFGRMDDATPLSVEQVIWLSTDQGQDLLADPVDVPAPAPLALLLGGLAMLRLRLRSKMPASD
jgi:hypothetical protein